MITAASAKAQLPSQHSASSNMLSLLILERTPATMHDCPCTSVVVKHMAYKLILSNQGVDCLDSQTRVHLHSYRLHVMPCLAVAKHGQGEKEQCHILLWRCEKSASLRTYLGASGTRRNTWASTDCHSWFLMSATPCLLHRTAPGNRPASTPLLQAADSAGHKTSLRL